MRDTQSSLQGGDSKIYGLSYAHRAYSDHRYRVRYQYVVARPVSVFYFFLTGTYHGSELHTGQQWRIRGFSSLVQIGTTHTGMSSCMMHPPQTSGREDNEFHANSHGWP